MQAGGKRIKAATSVIALLFAGVALTASAAIAQSGNGLTPSPPGAEVEVRLQPTERGWIAGEVELEPDELRGDDVRWFAAHVGPAPAVIADQSAVKDRSGCLDVD